MAGWSSPDGEIIEWDGTIKAKRILSVDPITGSETDPIYVAASGALFGQISALSGAYYTHAADSSDPHGLYLTQTSMAIIGDQGAASQAYVVNVVYASTTASGAVAANYPVGTLYVLYTP